MDWKETVVSASENVFPGISLKVDSREPGIEVFSNLPLQMALYFNVVFLPVWLALIILFLIENYYLYGQFYKFIIVTIMCTVIVVEILRLYLGYEGNLKDRIPELAGFWMLSLLLQFPLQGFLLFNPYVGFYILEIVAQSVIFTMLCIELVSGYAALKNTATQQTAYFRRTKLGSNVDLTELESKYRLRDIDNNKKSGKMSE